MLELFLIFSLIRLIRFLRSQCNYIIIVIKSKVVERIKASEYNCAILKLFVIYRYLNSYLSWNS